MPKKSKCDHKRTQSVAINTIKCLDCNELFEITKIYYDGEVVYG